MKKLIKLLALLFALWFFFHSAIITIDGLDDEVQQADCILILGNTVNEDGTLSQRLKARMDKALELYRNNKAAKVVVSGGLGKEGHWEGTAMKNYLLEQGIPGSKVIVDNQGVNTEATAINYLALARENNFNSVIVVTQFYHISRTRLALHRQGISNIYSAHAEYFEWRDLYSIVREFFGYYKYFLFSR